MKVCGYLILEPEYGAWDREKVVGAKFTGIRQKKPQSLSRGQRAIHIDVEVPASFFDPPRIEFVAAQIEEPDTPESIVAKMQGLVAVREALAEYREENVVVQQEGQE